VRADESHEVELKLLVPPEDLPRLRRHPRVRELTVGRPRSRALASVYFDNPELDLLREGLVLRLRRSGRSTVQAVKTTDAGHAGLFARGEWEAAVAGDQPELAAVPDPLVRARVARTVAGQDLAPVLQTDVRRTQRRLRRGDCEVLFDLDVGEVRTSAGALPVCELELELVRGDPPGGPGA
jgi:inorganic triphosphatase YgiF